MSLRLEDYPDPPEKCGQQRIHANHAARQRAYDARVRQRQENERKRAADARRFLEQAMTSESLAEKWSFVQKALDSLRVT